VVDAVAVAAEPVLVRLVVAALLPPAVAVVVLAVVAVQRLPLPAAALNRTLQTEA
jgi:hypothetical protein